MDELLDGWVVGNLYDVVKLIQARPSVGVANKCGVFGGGGGGQFPVVR